MKKHELEDFVDLFAGRLLGQGIHRKVFEHRHDPSLVIKVQYRDQTAANRNEWETWRMWGDAALGKWLAPCVDISPRGTVLLQRRVQPLLPENYPTKLPACLTDLKASNFGLYRGRVVSCDYATLIVTPSLKLRKVEFFDD